MKPYFHLEVVVNAVSYSNFVKFLDTKVFIDPLPYAVFPFLCNVPFSGQRSRTFTLRQRENEQ